MNQTERNELKQMSEFSISKEHQDQLTHLAVNAYETQAKYAGLTLDLLTENQKMRELLQSACYLIPSGYKTRNEIEAFLSEPNGEQV